MARYELAFRESVGKDLRAVPKKDVARILKRIEALRDDPRPAGCEKLSAREKYRVRQGVYRIVYELLDSRLLVIIVKVAHRSKVYKALNRK